MGGQREEGQSSEDQGSRSWGKQCFSWMG